MLVSKKKMVQCLFMFWLLLHDIVVSDWDKMWTDDCQTLFHVVFVFFLPLDQFSSSY